MNVAVGQSAGAGNLTDLIDVGQAGTLLELLRERRSPGGRALDVI